MQVTVKAGERAEVRIEMKEKEKKAAAVPPPETKIKEVPKVTETQKGPEAPNAEKRVDWATGRCEAPVLKVGDKWTYRLFSHAYNEKKIETQEVVEVKEDVYIMKISGQDNLFAYDKKTLNLAYSIGKNGRRISSSDERFNRVFEFPFFLDKQWVYKTSDLLGLMTRIHEFRVEALEEVQTPAGKFMAFKIYTLVKWSSLQKGWIRHWYSPEAKGWVKKEYDKSVAWGVNNWDAELISYELK